MEGFGQQHELTDGTYDFQDLLEIIAVMDNKAENEKRYAGWLRKQR